MLPQNKARTLTVTDITGKQVYTDCLPAMDHPAKPAAAACGGDVFLYGYE
jgi:hypothetical protein